MILGLFVKLIFFEVGGGGGTCPLAPPPPDPRLPVLRDLIPHVQGQHPKKSLSLSGK